MLAYAFWHWKRRDISSDTYEARQCEFQAALSSHPPDGFVRGTTVRLSGADWAADGAESYEDWYLVRDMGALSLLNDAAISGPRKEPHDAVARLAAGGTAGLYGLKAGAALPVPALATWFGKPDGMSYTALFDTLGPLAGGGALWMRQMVLGPAPEFCLHHMEPVELPASFRSRRLQLTPVFGARA
jgi:hypothetical protein